jgi:hypothetical protein
MKPHARRSAALLVLVFTFATAAALTCAAAAQAFPGAVPGLASSSHPDASTWYSNNKPVFAWDSLAGTVGFSWVFDQSLSTAPPDHELSFATTTAAVGPGATNLPWEAAVGDFNNDGKLDVATANYGDDSVSVLLGNGDGTFGAAQVTDTSHAPNHYGPHSVAVGDFNEDGNLDLAVADFLYGRISILLGKGDGTFNQSAVFLYGTPTGQSASSVCVADFNGDGHEDLAVADYHGNCVAVLLGDGHGAFGAKTEFATGTNAEAVTAADFNHDGNADLAVANWGAGTVSVLMGKGDGTFETPVDYTVGTGPHGIAVGDFNGDGWADLAVANWSSNSVSVLVNDQSGGFTVTSIDHVGSVPSTVVVGDYDGDGHADIAVADQNGSAVTLLFGKGDGTFQPASPTDSGMRTSVSEWPHGIARGDFDGDGRPDIVVTHAVSDVNLDAGNTITLLRNVRTTAYPASADGLWYFHIAGVDAAGATGPTTTRAVRIDTTAPLTTVDGGGSHNTPVTLTFTAIDPNAPDSSGVDFTQYKLDAADWAPVPVDGVSIDAPSNHSNDGKYTILYRSQDNAGNLESQQSATVKIDTVAPETTVHGADTAWHTSPVTLTFTASDPNAPDSSGVDITQYKVDAAGWTDGSEVTVSGEGSHTILYRSQDKAGNVENQQSATVKIDTTAPETTVHGADTAWHTSPVTLTFTAADPNAPDSSGGVSTQYKVDAADWVTGTDVTVSGDGSHTVLYHSQDQAGNLEGQRTATVKIDTTPPTVTASGVDILWHKSTVHVTLNAADSVSGVHARQYRVRGTSEWRTTVGGNTFDVPTLPGGVRVYEYRAVDEAGNASVPATFKIRMDSTHPVAQALFPVTVRRLSTAWFYYKITDVAGSSATVTLKIYNSRGGRVYSKVLGAKASNVKYLYKLRIGLARGTYTYRLYATDLAGNSSTSTKYYSNRLTVR